MTVNKQYIRYTLVGLLIALVIIQFFQIEKSNPERIPTKDFLRIEMGSGDVADLIRLACYDCHSNEVIYPWYTSFQPIGWWVKGHVKGGIKHLNFSEWGDYQPKKRIHKLEECVEVMEKGNMPLKSYTWMHSKSKLSEKERKMLKDWFASL